MKKKVSDYIADLLAENGIKDCFAVTGGAAMHLNDSFGHHDFVECTYFHHEQSAAIAAEAYARVSNEIAAVCVSTGPGATNAITGVLCGWMGSIPMLVLSGQVRYATSIYSLGPKLRSSGVQEHDIIHTVDNMTKYCEIVTNPQKIRYVVEKALYLAREGRPGPCWVDIPLDVQGSVIETDDLEGFCPEPSDHKPDDGVAEKIIERIKNAKRPVLFAGNGIRIAGAHDSFLELCEKLNIPVVTGMSSVDAIASEHRLYTGRSGITGDRAGNFAIQNSDLLLSIGSRQSFLQTGFDRKAWAVNAYKIVCDIDIHELQKKGMDADMKVCCDAKALIEEMNRALPEQLPEKTDWLDHCRLWREKYPVVTEKRREGETPDIYAFYDVLTSRIGEEDCLVVGVGTSRVAGSQSGNVKEGMRFITNSSAAPMGYCLPAAIGACIARGKKKVYLVTGDGSLQMNIQELQTIVHNKLPVVIFVMNNKGYHSIRMTQRNYFGDDLVGVGPDSGDISFPDLSKLIPAYGITYIRCDRMEDMNWAIEFALSQQSCVCEVMLSTEYVTEPKVASKRMPDGGMKAASLEDMSPFLSREELESNMVDPHL